jgi:hypothetical protein
MLFKKGYRIQRTRGEGLKFVCLQCPFSINTTDFDLRNGHMRTQAATAINEHVRSAHPVRPAKKAQSELMLPTYSKGF